MSETKKLIVLTGPTASGKTALSIALAEALDGEIVSADSMQIYRGMDIGTAKATREEMRGIPHHMLDVADPGESFSAARYAEEADRCVADILSRGKQPIIVGGTGLYIDALLTGRVYGDAPGEDGLREALNAEYDALGGEAMRQKLAEFDPERAAKLAPADKKRIVRAIEVYTLTGETITEHDRRTQALPPKYASDRFALWWRERETLYRRIDRRVDEMLDSGLEDEVRALLARGIPQNATAMQAIGYKELAAALRGESTTDEAVESIKRESRRYAKRQLTWLRRDAELHWLAREDYPTVEALVQQILFTTRQEQT